MALLKKNRVKGFTIAELLVVMTLFGVLISFFYFGWGIVQRSSSKLINDYLLEIELNNMMKDISLEFSQADSIILVEKNILCYDEFKTSKLELNQYAIVWNKYNVSDSLILDSSYYSLNKINSHKVSQLDLTVILSGNEYHFLLENKRQLK
jgi:prepilin-type N-terminal cleavage/methylation domain-containing protein